MLDEAKNFDQIKVIDFGTAHQLKEGGFCRKIMGTRSYIAPEVYQKDYGTKCDIWSVGVMTYLFLGGYLPFGDRKTTNDEMAELICKGEFNFDSKVWEGIS